ncbi:hypothetical protein [Serinicoccus kebangsaanensis]|uniref:hypothetical protein n=1 Tax=Serinicoccus kebangsaanensis TaxID=2602069 RepID=UPI00124CEB96|nr:hypothetical protein [Serinicoccus kebangsaanensis]
MARAYRRPAPTAPPIEVLVAKVDEELIDQESRPPSRPLWEALDDEEKEAVVTLAQTEHGISAVRTWLIGNRQDDADRLLGAVVWTLGDAR